MIPCCPKIIVKLLVENNRHNFLSQLEPKVYGTFRTLFRFFHPEFDTPHMQSRWLYLMTAHIHIHTHTHTWMLVKELFARDVDKRVIKVKYFNKPRKKELNTTNKPCTIKTCKTCMLHVTRYDSLTWCSFWVMRWCAVWAQSGAPAMVTKRFVVPSINSPL